MRHQVSGARQVYSNTAVADHAPRTTQNDVLCIRRMLDVSILLAFTRRLREEVRRERHLTYVLRCVLHRAVHIKPPHCSGLVYEAWRKEYRVHRLHHNVYIIEISCHLN